MNSNKNKIVPIVPNVHSTNSTNGTNSTNEYRYILEKGSKKYICPNCKKKTFVRYIDTEGNKYLPDQYGRCDRESKCSYHLNPYLDGFSKDIFKQEHPFSDITISKQKDFCTPYKQQPTPEPVFFDIETFKQTLSPERYEQNTFIQNLLNRVNFPFNIDEVTKVIQLYGLGTVTNGYRAGGNTFPFIDIKGNIRAVQVKQFDEQNHTTGTDFLHSIIEKSLIQNNKPIPDWLEMYIKQEGMVSCLFGEHLLSKYSTNPIALVEAPKTAVYGTLYFGLPETPESLIWLAVYNKSSFTFDKIKVLKGRSVIVFPDLSKNGITFNEWETKTKEFENHLSGTRFIFSDLLEKLAPEPDKTKGYDIADYLIKLDWEQFRKNNLNESKRHPEPTPEQAKIEPKQIVPVYHKTTARGPNEKRKLDKLDTIKGISGNWDIKIHSLETYFSEIIIPEYKFKLNTFSTITDCKKFVNNHLNVVRVNNGNDTYISYLYRLEELKQALNGLFPQNIDLQLH